MGLITYLYRGYNPVILSTMDIQVVKLLLWIFFGVPLSKNPFHKGIPKIQSTNLPLLDLRLAMEDSKKTRLGDVPGVS